MNNVKIIIVAGLASFVAVSAAVYGQLGEAAPTNGSRTEAIVDANGNLRFFARGYRGVESASTHLTLERPEHLFGASSAVLRDRQQRIGDVQDAQRTSRQSCL